MYLCFNSQDLKKTLININDKIAFVPTMGNLHQGHLSLITTAKKHSNFIAVSIFINPSQFDNKQDLQSYPVSLEQDLKLLKENKVDLVFIPKKEDMYPTEQLIWINEEYFSNILCGKFRFGHFKGVLTIVAKLLNIMQPDFMILGLKDYQQFILLYQMTKQLCFNCKVIPSALIRAKNGLALSSRNQRLPLTFQSSIIYQTLCLIKERVQQQNCPAEELRALAKDNLKSIKLEYLEFVKEGTLEIATSIIEKTKHRCLIAVYIDNVRLIDNLLL